MATDRRRFVFSFLALLADGAILIDAVASVYAGPWALKIGAILIPARRLQAELAVVAVLVCFAVLAGRGRPTQDRPIAPLVALLAFASFLANTRLVGSADTLPAAYLPMVLARDHTLAFDNARYLFEHDGGWAFYLVRLQGHVVSKFPVATGLLAIPFYLPAMVGTLDPPNPLFNDMQKIAASGMTAIGVAFLFDAMRRIVGLKAALTASAVYALGTAIASILSQALWQHTGAVLGLSVAIWALVRPFSARVRGIVVGVGAGTAVACRPVDVLLAAAVFAALARKEGSAVPWALLVSALPIGLLGAYDTWAFGAPWTTGYLDEAAGGWTAPWLTGFAGLLVSPGRGLLVFEPVVLFALWSLVRWRSDLPGPIAVPLTAGFATYVIVMAKWWAWDGAFSAGPRMLSDTLPLVALGFGLAFSRLRGRWRGALAVAAGWSVAVHALLIYVPPGPATKRLVWEQAAGVWSVRSFPLVAYLQRN